MFRSLVLAESSLPTDLLDSDCFRNNVAWVLWFWKMLTLIFFYFRGKLCLP